MLKKMKNVIVSPTGAAMVAVLIAWDVFGRGIVMPWVTNVLTKVGVNNSTAA